MGQTVKREQRLKIKLVLQFPDINRNKSYSAIERKYLVTVDGEPAGLVDMTTVPSLVLITRCRALVRIEKRFGDKSPDSITEYRVGENFMTVQAFGKKKRVALDFTDNNLIYVKDDVDFTSLEDIS